MTSAESFDAVLCLVLHVVRAEVDIPADEVGVDTSLLDLPAFDSMTIVRVVEEIERAARVEIEPDRIVPETFDSVRSIAHSIWPSINKVPATTPGARTDTGSTP